MGALVVIGLLIFAVAIVLVVRAVASPRVRMAAHLRQIETYGFVDATASESQLSVHPPLGRSINAIAESVGSAAIARITSLKPLPSRELASAGFYSLSVEAFHGYRVMGAVALPSLLVFELLGTGGNAVLAIALGIAAAAGCWVLFG